MTKHFEIEVACKIIKEKNSKYRKIFYMKSRKIRFLKQSKNDKKMLVFSLLRLSAVWWRLLCAEHRLLHCSRQQQSISDPVQYRVRRSSHCYNVEILKFCLVEIDWICFGGGRGCWDSFFSWILCSSNPKGL